MASTLIRIDQRLEKRFLDLARMMGRDPADCIHQAMETYLSHYEWLLDSMGDTETRDLAERALNVAFAKWGVDI